MFCVSGLSLIWLCVLVAGTYNLAFYIGTAVVDLINVMIRPLIFGGVIAWMVRCLPSLPILSSCSATDKTQCARNCIQRYPVSHLTLHVCLLPMYLLRTFCVL